MVNYYYTQINKITEIETPKPGCWISMIDPDYQEMLDMADHFEICPNILQEALTGSQNSSIEIHSDYTFIMFNIPTTQKKWNGEYYDTIPLSIILLHDTIITVCRENAAIINTFTSGRISGFHTAMKSRFILQFMYHISSVYKNDLKNIDKKSDELEVKIHEQIGNNCFRKLHSLQNSLEKFSVALKANRTVLEQFLKTDLVKKHPNDAVLLEDILIENRQAILMSKIYGGIVERMIHTSSEVMTKRMNMIMCSLTVITVIMTIPTMILSSFHMNAISNQNTFIQNAYGVPIALGLLVSFIVFLVLSFMRVRLYYKRTS